MSITNIYGFLALLSLVVLFLIYFIKPSYQNKILASTYIWKESLKYKKSPRPTSKLKNILLILLQVLIITIATLIIVGPLIHSSSVSMLEQNIIILDSSSSMQVANEDGTRFSRAIAEIKKRSKEEIENNRPVSIILSSDTASFIVKKETDINEINNKLDSLSCAYGEGSINEAIKLAKEMIKTNARADIYYYTGRSYNDSGDINIVNVADSDEWNVAILELSPVLNENYYEFEANVASFNMDKYVTLYLTIEGANDEKKTVKASIRVSLSENKPQRVSFKNLNVYSYDKATISVRMDDNSMDSFSLDNEYILNGGRKPELNIQYYSKAPNNFFSGALLVLKNKYKDLWDINIYETNKIDEAHSSGYDFYIYEHTMPSTLPADGFSMLVNPDFLPTGVKLDLGQPREGSFTMEAGINHDIMKYLDPERITATSYRPITLVDGYDSLMKCNGEDVFVINRAERLLVLSLNLNRSNLAISLEFPILMANIFEYTMPAAILKNVYTVNEEIRVSTRGYDLNLNNGILLKPLEIPSSITIAVPGEYSIIETLYSNKKVESKLFIRVSANESDITKIYKNENHLFELDRPMDALKDIYIYLAAALLVAVLLERYLHTKEGI